MKIVQEQLDRLKKIILNEHGCIGCEVPLSEVGHLHKLGLVEVRATLAGLKAVAGSEMLAPSQIDLWIRAFKSRETKDMVTKRRKDEKRRELLADIEKAEASDREWIESRRAAAEAEGKK